MENQGFAILSFNKNKITENRLSDVGEIESLSQEYVHWIDVHDLKNAEGIRQLGTALGIHQLIMTDILNTGQMVKMDNYDDCLFLILKMIHYSTGTTHLESEHAGIILKDNVILSFQEFGGDIFAAVRHKLLAGKDRIRRSGADYLCYELVNTVVENYFSVIDEVGDTTDSIEEELIAKPEKSTLNQIYFVKRKLMNLRKSVYPLRELIGDLYSSGSPLIGESVKIYYHDVYDHLIQIADSVETYQDILSNMLDIYLSSISNKTNDIMKVLTMFSTIFIPLTFLAGIYGMNFKNIPELNFQYGYGIFWLISLVLAVCMLFFFHRKKWF